MGTLTAVQFWLVMGDSYTITQAKRLYKLIGAGSVLGAVAGAALARVVSERFRRRRPRVRTRLSCSP